MKKIHPLNILFSLTSLTVLAVNIERFSFTARTFLQPYNFLRLHELFQMTVLILATVIIPFLMLRYVTDNFKKINARWGFSLLLIFVIGVYFYATGNGVHEMASFSLNTYCNVKNLIGNECKGLFINDYYTGNIIYFVGAFLMNISLVLFELRNPNNTFKTKDRTLMILNSLIYSLAIIAYAGFDVVLVGLVFGVIMTGFVDYYFWLNRKRYLEIPLTTSMAIAYTIGTVASILIRVIK